MMTTKTKPDSLSTLIHELDDWISKYVRLNAADENGRCRCISCDAKMHWTLMDCAHFKNRDNMATRFYLPNLAPACQGCNRFDVSDHIANWAAFIGPDKVSELNEISKSLMKWTRIDIDVRIEFYKAEVKKLRKQKHL